MELEDVHGRGVGERRKILCKEGNVVFKAIDCSCACGSLERWTMSGLIAGRCFVRDDDAGG